MIKRNTCRGKLSRIQFCNSESGLLLRHSSGQIKQPARFIGPLLSREVSRLQVEI